MHRFEGMGKEIRNGEGDEKRRKGAGAEIGFFFFRKNAMIKTKIC